MPAHGLRIGFAGTPVFAQVALQALLVAGHTIACVLTQPDRPAGRGLKLQPSPVKQLAQQVGAPVLQPQSLRLNGRAPADAESTRQTLAALQLDVLVVAAYGLILPPWLLRLPRLGCLNIHASLLPRWRGAAPIHRAIEAGDACTGITIMQMDEGLDTGDMLLVESEAIAPDDTTVSLHDRLAGLGGRMIVDAVSLATQGALRPTPQPPDGVTYAHKIERAEAAIDWSLPAVQIERRVRAFDPFPGASFQALGQTVKLWHAAPADGQAAPGTLLRTDGMPVVACGDGALALLQLQRPGGRRLSGREWLAAAPDLHVGTRL